MKETCLANRVYVGVCFMTDMNQTDYVSHERLMCQTVFHEGDTCAKHVCLQTDAYVPKTACLETDAYVPKTICYTRSTCPKCDAWETLVTSIYGHETEARAKANMLQETETHVPKTTDTQMQTKSAPKQGSHLSLRSIPM
jgi:hypothetical protein